LKYGTIPGQTFAILYGDGETLRGSPGYDDITIAGITVKKQEIGIMNQVSGGGDGITSGLLGLAYPILTRAFNGSNPKNTNPGDPGQMVYDPIFTTMCKQGLLSPQVFSMSMDRNGSGWLTFGGLPPVNYSTKIGSTPIKMVSLYIVSSLQYCLYRCLLVSCSTSGSGI
jgi:hypothetical protein